jgi:hypothetical protein
MALVQMRHIWQLLWAKGHGPFNIITNGVEEGAPLTHQQTESLSKELPWFHIKTSTVFSVR